MGVVVTTRISSYSRDSGTRVRPVWKVNIVPGHKISGDLYPIVTNFTHHHTWVSTKVTSKFLDRVDTTSTTVSSPSLLCFVWSFTTWPKQGYLWVFSPSRQYKLSLPLCSWMMVGDKRININSREKRVILSFRFSRSRKRQNKFQH